MNIDSYLECIQQKEAQVKAWKHHDPQQVRQQIRTANPGGSLAGLAVGVKDIFDTADMPTGYGSSAYEGHQPDRDSWAVQRLRAAGAIIMGKTVTTEFAYTHAGPTRNPHNLAHTPGGSSSGSAAAVAAGMVPVALGTQTGGSVIRPSAYCGVIGFKPTHGAISLQGVCPLSPSMDTLGIHAATTELARQVFSVLCPRQHRDSSFAREPLRLAWFPGPLASQAQPQAIQLLQSVREKIETSGLGTVTDLEFGSDHALGLSESNRIIMRYEAARAHRDVFSTRRDLLGAATVGLIETGLRTTDAQYEQAMQQVERAHAAFMAATMGLDAVLTLSSPGEAPRFEEGTGSSSFNQAWTTLGAPCLTLPAGKGQAGLPLGIQLIARPGEDHRLLDIGQRIQQTCLNT
ncbi:amidase [Orrella marina]|uniref:Amidase n=1 Tax=Orrella marina TaxID=2163011 RepID=A0A2R4XIZ6_9BURK|nr:amidase [Orrella marina]AWB33714.1 amidase [Orrella marina]